MNILKLWQINVEIKIYFFHIVSYIFAIYCILILAKIITFYLIQWKPLNVITLGPDKSDHINRMITLTKQKEAKMAFWDIILREKVITLSNLITLTVITLSSFHCFTTTMYITMQLVFLHFKKIQWEINKILVHWVTSKTMYTYIQTIFCWRGERKDLQFDKTIPRSNFKRNSLAFVSLWFVTKRDPSNTR